MKYKELIDRMTLEEKCSLLSGKTNFETKAVERLGVPSIYLSDGPHGLRKQAEGANHLGLGGSIPATCYPTAATVANSWDAALGEELGEHLGAECVAQGVSMLLGPGLNMKRSPLCGRNFEYFSEDPVLAGKMAAAYIRGIQSKGVSACPKHFAVNSQELRRMHSDSILDERTFREIYLAGFEIAVKEGKPLSVMSSYNRINGEYANEDKTLLQDILRDEWGFEGIVVSDWGASNDRVDGLVAGNHLEMPATGGNSDRELTEAVRSGRLAVDVLDQRLDEYLQVLYTTVIPHGAKPFDAEAHHAFARRAAEESIVLLRNEGGLLPLAAGTKVAVIGDFAETPRYQGAGSSMVNPTKLDSALDCLKAGGLSVAGYEPGFLRHGGGDEAKKNAAVDLAKRADVVLLYLGLDELSESEGLDRAHMRMAQNQLDLIDAVCAVNARVAVVLSGGAAIEMPWAEKVSAIVHGYLGGQAGAGAMVNVLTGKVNPSGKLSESYPMTYADVPTVRYFPGEERTAEYREGPFIGYRYYETAGVKVRFPFGFGLSYTTFTYSDLTVTDRAVTFTLTNTGKLAGAEAAQVYVGKAGGKIFRPARELKGFVKVPLQPGETRTVTVPLDDNAFRYYNVRSAKWETEGGTYQIMVGASSTDLRLTGSVDVKGSDAFLPYDAAKLPSYFSGKVTGISDTEFTALLGHPLPPANWDRTLPLERNDTLSQLFYARNILARLAYKVLTHKKNSADKKGQPDLNILFIYNMPFRGIAKMMGGGADMAMVDGILEIVNGHFFRGVAHTISARSRMIKATKATAQALADAGK